MCVMIVPIVPGAHAAAAAALKASAVAPAVVATAHGHGAGHAAARARSSLRHVRGRVAKSGCAKMADGVGRARAAYDDDGPLVADVAAVPPPVVAVASPPVVARAPAATLTASPSAQLASSLSAQLVASPSAQLAASPSAPPVAPPPQPPPPPRRPIELPLFSAGSIGSGDKALPHILCYGDSNTAGFYDDGKRFEPYAETLARVLGGDDLPCKVTSCGLCGFTTDQMWGEQGSREVHPRVGPPGKGIAHLLDSADEPPTLAIIMTGTNDLGNHLSVDAIVSHTARLHAVCHDRGVPTFAISPTAHVASPMRKLRKQLAEAMSVYAQRTPGVVGHIDVEELVPRSAGGCWEPDKLHLSPAGSRRLGRRLAPHVAIVLRKLLQPVQPVRACGGGAVAMDAVSTSADISVTDGFVPMFPPSRSTSEVSLFKDSLEEMLLAAEGTQPTMFRTGDQVHVWSNTAKKWCRGYVEAVSDDHGAIVFFTMPSGDGARKELPVGHPNLRHMRSARPMN